jgi:cyanate lyase
VTRPRATQRSIDREALGAELQLVLATLVDLSRIGEHAHWNVVGPSFRSMHLELDELIHAWRGAADAVGERIAALGGFPDGCAETVAGGSELPALTEGPQPDRGLRLVPDGRADRIDDLDPVTADLLRSIVATLEGQLVGDVDMDRRDVTAQILGAKRRKGLSFTQIAEHIGADRVWLTAALHGQHPLSGEQAAAVAALLEMPAEAAAVLQEIPTRGSFEGLPPADPTISRLHEVLQLYGPALKALIHEDFGDGIMSAIMFDVALERRETDDGPHVRITLDGKFLPYVPWEG